MKYLAISLFFCLNLATTFAQNAPTEPVRKRERPERTAEIRTRVKERLKVQRTAFITQRLELTEAESAQFWAIHNEYEAKLEQIRQSAKPATTDISKMSDAEAEKMIAADFDRQARELDLKRDYYQRLKKVLSPAKIVKLHRAEREFKLMVAKKMRDRQSGGGKGRPRRPRGFDE